VAEYGRQGEDSLGHSAFVREVLLLLRDVNVDEDGEQLTVAMRKFIRRKQQPPAAEISATSTSTNWLLQSLVGNNTDASAGGDHGAGGDDGSSDGESQSHKQQGNRIDKRKFNKGMAHRKSYTHAQKLQVLRMRFVENCTADEIAALTEISKSNIERWCTPRSREKLEAGLGEGGLASVAPMSDFHAKEKPSSSSSISSSSISSRRKGAATEDGDQFRTQFHADQQQQPYSVRSSHQSGLAANKNSLILQDDTFPEPAQSWPSPFDFLRAPILVPTAVQPMHKRSRVLEPGEIPPSYDSAGFGGATLGRGGGNDSGRGLSTGPRDRSYSAVEDSGELTSLRCTGEDPRSNRAKKHRVILFFWFSLFTDDEDAAMMGLLGERGPQITLLSLRNSRV
jgi:hypothetical protein